MFDFSSDDINKYSLACLRAANIYAAEFKTSCVKPAIINSLRGANPIVKIVEKALKSVGIEPTVYLLPTSGFLYQRDEVIYEGLKDIFDKELSSGIGNLIFIDTMISGSSLRGFKQKFKKLINHEFINELESKLITFSFIGIKENHNNYQENYNEHSFGTNNLVLKSYVLPAGDIMTEDVPELLGVDYPFNSNDKSLKLPITSEVKSSEPIRVDGLVFQSNKTTSELFQDIILNEIYKIMKNNLVKQFNY